MLVIAGGDSRIEISTLTDDQKALHTAKVNELLNMDKCGVVEVFDTPQSQQVISTRWVSKQRLDGAYEVRLVARGFEHTVSSDTDFYAGTPKLTTLRALLTIAATHGNPIASEAVTVHIINHRCRMVLQESFSRTQDFSSNLWYSQHTENQRHELQPVDIRSFDVREETCTTIRRFDPFASHG